MFCLLSDIRPDEEPVGAGTELPVSDGDISAWRMAQPAAVVRIRTALINAVAVLILMVFLLADEFAFTPVFPQKNEGGFIFF